MAWRATKVGGTHCHLLLHPLGFTLSHPHREAAMASSFNVSSAGGYEQLMGRWSKRLAPLFVGFSGLSDGERVLDVVVVMVA
jgi:hypothetical protein